MARSRRRSASRSSSRSGASGWLNVANLLKIGAGCLVAGGGTYGVFYTVSNMSAGSQNITEGVEVGTFGDTELAMSQKPPLPDAVGDSGVRFASAGTSTPAAISSASNPSNKPNPALGGEKPAENPAIRNMFADKKPEAQNDPPKSNPGRLPGALPSPTSIGGTGLGSTGLGSTAETKPAATKPSLPSPLGTPKTDSAIANNAPLSSPTNGLRPTGATGNGLPGLPSGPTPIQRLEDKTKTDNPAANANPSALASDNLLNTLRSSAQNNGPKLPSNLPSANGGLEAGAGANLNSRPDPSSSLTAKSPAPLSGLPNGPSQPALPGSAPRDLAPPFNGGAKSNSGGLPGLPPNDALAGLTNGPSSTGLQSGNSEIGRPNSPSPNPLASNLNSANPNLTSPNPLQRQPSSLGSNNFPNNPSSPSPSDLNPSSPRMASSLSNRNASSLGAASIPSLPNNQNRPNPSLDANTSNNSSFPPNRGDNGIANRSVPTQNPNSGLSSLGDSRLGDARLGGAADTQVRPAGYPNNAPNNSLSNAAPATRRPDSTLVSNQPGEPQWEIQQNAAIVLEKRAPEQVQVNVPATFVLVVRNVGRVPAAQVLIRDRIPQGARLVQTTPKPTRQQGDQLEWDLATLPPGETVQIVTELIPTERGELGSVAEVSLAAVAACRTRCTQPKLVIEHSAPPQVLVGQQVVMNITVRNDGDGPAENVTIRETVPDLLRHQSGSEIENPIGRLLPGQSRNLQLPLLATKAGQVQNTVRVTGDGKLSHEHSVSLQIVAPSLQVDVNGPTRRFLSREAVHQMSVKNNGTANATNVQMMAQLPRGLKYESSSPAGRYDPSRHAVFWAIQQLPSQQSEQLSVTTLPLAPGDQIIKFQALADLNQPQEANHKLVVEQLSELFFEVDDVDDPIEINSNTTYVVRLENQGSQVANDVSMIVDLPAGIEPLRVDGPVQHQTQNGPNGGKRIVFAPIAVLNPGAKLATQIQVRGTREGDHKIEVQLTSAQRTAAVAKQEITKVYSDLR